MFHKIIGQYNSSALKIQCGSIQVSSLHKPFTKSIHISASEFIEFISHLGAAPREGAEWILFAPFGATSTAYLHSEGHAKRNKAHTGKHGQ